MQQEALAFWDAIKGKCGKLCKELMRKSLQCERYDVTTAPNGTKIGVKLPYGNTELHIPYSAEVSTAKVGDTVLVIWWGSLSTAKAWYFGSGPSGKSNGAELPVGSLYWNADNDTNPTILLGYGVWEQIKDVFVLAVGDEFQANTTGGEKAHTLTTAEIPSHNHVQYVTTAAGGTLETNADFTDYTTQGRRTSQLINTGDTGGGTAHNNMPPYMTAYCWKRTA